MENKQFLTTVKLFFSNKIGGNEKKNSFNRGGLTLASEDNEVAEIFMSYFETKSSFPSE